MANGQGGVVGQAQPLDRGLCMGKSGNPTKNVQVGSTLNISSAND